MKRIASRLRGLGISNIVESSGVSIGKRFVRNYGLGTPLGITVDFDTLRDGSVTLRERDSTSQLRASEEDIIQAIRNLADGSETWKEVSLRFPAFMGQIQTE